MNESLGQICIIMSSRCFAVALVSGSLVIGVSGLSSTGTAALVQLTNATPGQGAAAAKS